MIWSDSVLREKRSRGQLVVDPILDDGVQISGARIDLRLDTRLRVLKSEQTEAFDPLMKTVRAEEVYETLEVPFGEPFHLHPGRFVLGNTFECIRIPDQVFGRFDGRSSLARRGLLVHITASGIDPGFIGSITLEAYNVGNVPVKLYPLMRIGSLTIEEIRGKVREPYWKKKDAKFGGAEGQSPAAVARDDDASTVVKTLEALGPPKPEREPPL